MVHTSRLLAICFSAFLCAAHAQTLAITSGPSEISDLAFEVKVSYSGFPAYAKGMIVSLNSALGTYLSDGKLTIGSSTSGTGTVTVMPPINFLQTVDTTTVTLQAFMISYTYILANITEAWKHAITSANMTDVAVISRPSYGEGGRLKFMGVNLAGGEVSNQFYSKSSAYYFRQLNFNFYNLFTSWKKVQPTITSTTLDSTAVANLADAVSYITLKLGAFCSVELHDYARYGTTPLGTAPATSDAFARVWRLLAQQFKNNSRVIFSLTNQPHDQVTLAYITAVNAAITAIRATGAENMILVQSSRWNSALNFLDIDSYGASNAEVMSLVTDPKQNTYLNIHQYFDSSFGGSTSGCINRVVGAQFLSGVTLWLRRNNKKAILGEFGATYDDTCAATVSDTLNYVQANSDVWMGWAWWNAGKYLVGNAYNIDPSGGTAAQPQEAWISSRVNSGICPSSYLSSDPQTAYWSSCNLLNNVEGLSIEIESPLDGNVAGTTGGNNSTTAPGTGGKVVSLTPTKGANHSYLSFYFIAAISVLLYMSL